MKLSELVKSKVVTCAKCFSIKYALPCVVDAKLAGHLDYFGKPAYAIETTQLLKIDSGGFQIEARAGSKTIKFAMPKKYEKVERETIVELAEFEKGLAAWISDTLDSEIEV